MFTLSLGLSLPRLFIKFDAFAVGKRNDTVTQYAAKRSSDLAKLSKAGLYCVSGTLSRNIQSVVSSLSSSQPSQLEVYGAFLRRSALMVSYAKKSG